MENMEEMWKMEDLGDKTAKEDGNGASMIMKEKN